VLLEKKVNVEMLRGRERERERERRSLVILSVKKEARLSATALHGRSAGMVEVRRNYGVIVCL